MKKNKAKDLTAKVVLSCASTSFLVSKLNLLCPSVSKLELGRLFSSLVKLSPQLGQFDNPLHLNVAKQFMHVCLSAVVMLKA
jgi:hypothetical protein